MNFQNCSVCTRTASPPTTTWRRRSQPDGKGLVFSIFSLHSDHSPFPSSLSASLHLFDVLSVFSSFCVTVLRPTLFTGALILEGLPLGLRLTIRHSPLYSLNSFLFQSPDDAEEAPSCFPWGWLRALNPFGEWFATSVHLL